MAWACFLLLVFYEEHVAMQQTMMAARINTDHEGDAATADDAVEDAAEAARVGHGVRMRARGECS